VNTDQLIDVLSANLEPVSPGQFGKTLTLAILASGAAAFVLMLATVGVRPDPGSTAHLRWIAVKLLFALSAVAVGAPLLVRSMRPGLEKVTHWARVFSPFAVAIAVVVAMLILDARNARTPMLLGATSMSPVHCLLYSVSFAAVPLAALIWALRKGAPTQLRLCGATAGIVAGGLGAAAYALCCLSDTITFIAIWYALAILICAVVGSQLGPRLLRW
jgi:hypothetical protein